MPSFTIFPELPAELRCQIWRAAMFPRIIEMSLKSRKCPCPGCKNRGGCLPSTLAFVSEESKAETELLYTKLPFIRDGREIYSYNINFEIDVVCFSQRHFRLIEVPDPESELPDWAGDIQKLGFPLWTQINHRRPRGCPSRCDGLLGKARERKLWEIIHFYLKKVRQLVFFLDDIPQEEDGTNILEQWTEYWNDPHPEWLATAMEERNSWYGQLPDQEVMDTINGSLSDFQEETAPSTIFINLVFRR
jgi:hypothetical protein